VPLTSRVCIGGLVDFFRSALAMGLVPEQLTPIP